MKQFYLSYQQWTWILDMDLAWLNGFAVGMIVMFGLTFLFWTYRRNKNGRSL